MLMERILSVIPGKHSWGTAAFTILAAALLCSRVWSQDKQVSKAVPATKPQPIPFSHKLHTQFMQQCNDCHQISAEEDISYPPEAQCMPCHATIAAKSPAINKLTEYYKQQKPVPSVQIYKLPDFVYFSHGVHYTKAKIGCDVCHGPVAERDVITKEKSISMVACVDCHREKGAPVKCNTCHNPNP